MFLLEHAYYQAEVLKMIPFAQLRQTCLRKCVTRIHGRNSSSVALNPVNGLKIYNSLSKTKSPLFTKHPGSLSWYRIPEYVVLGISNFFKFSHTYNNSHYYLGIYVAQQSMMLLILVMHGNLYSLQLSFIFSVNIFFLFIS